MNDIQVGEPQPVSPHNQALYEAGKQMLVESVSVGREFCKFMVGISTGAIPLYLALLQLALPKDYRPDCVKGIVGIAPAATLLAAATVFALGVFPQSDTFSLDLPDEIDEARTAVIDRRGRLAAIGFFLFAAAALAAIVVTIGALRLKAPDTPKKPTEIRLVW